MTTKLLKSLKTPFAWSMCGLLTITLLVTGCKKDEVTPELSVSPATATVGKAGDNVSVSITSNMEWSITDAATDKAWYTLSSKSGSKNETVTLNVKENKSNDSRVVTLTVTAGSLSKTVTITQDAGDKELVVSPAELVFKKEGETKTVTITGNVAFTLTSKCGLCTVPASGSNNTTLNIIAPVNPLAEGRVDTIIFKATGLGDRILTVKQDSAVGTLSLSGTALEYNNRCIAKNGKNSVDVTSNDRWIATVDKSWCDITKEGYRNKSIVVTLNERNYGTTPRTATITVKTEDNAVAKTITVTQTQEPVYNLLSIDFESADYTPTYSVEEGSDWRSYSEHAYARWSISQAAGNKYAVADASNGTAGETYESWIITPALDLDNATSKKIAFHSMVGKYVAGSSLEVYLLDTKAPSTANKLATARIAAAADTTAGGESGWIASGDITLMGSGVKYIGFRYTAKGAGGVAGVKSTYYRIDNFTFGTESIKLLTVSPSSIEFAANGETKQIRIDGNVSWTIDYSGATWCTPSVSSGNGAATITMTVPANTGSSHNGSIIISGGGLTKTVSVSQAAATILAEWDISTAVNGSLSLKSTNGESTLTFTNPSTVEPWRDIVKAPAYMHVSNWKFLLLDAWIFEVNPQIAFTGGNVKISVPVYANPSGPRDWKVQWSLDGSTNWTDANDPTYTVSTSKTTKVKTMTIGAATDKFYIRLVVDSNTNVNGVSGDISGQSRLADKITIEKAD